MSMFPTNILLTTDGSESSLPALRAADLSAKTGSGVHIIYVGKGISTPAAYNDPNSRDTDPRVRPGS